mgnify:CR=1 FL=1
MGWIGLKYDLVKLFFDVFITAETTLASLVGIFIGVSKLNYEYAAEAAINFGWGAAIYFFGWLVVKFLFCFLNPLTYFFIVVLVETFFTIIMLYVVIAVVYALSIYKKEPQNTWLEPW